MNKLDDLLKKREEEIIEIERNRKADIANEDSATANAFIGIFKGAASVFIFAFFFTGIFALILSWITGYKGGLTILIFFGIIIFGAISGYNDGYKEIRNK